MKVSQNVVIGALALVIVYMLFIAPMSSGYTPGQKKPRHPRAPAHRAPNPLKTIAKKITGRPEMAHR